jgi:hypothetical protein
VIYWYTDLKDLLPPQVGDEVDFKYDPRCGANASGVFHASEVRLRNLPPQPFDKALDARIAGSPRQGDPSRF